MLIGLVLFLTLGGVLTLLCFRADGRLLGTLGKVVLGGFALRLLVLQPILRDISFFTRGLGGDYQRYEWNAIALAHYWKATGIHFVTNDELKFINHASFHNNVFAMVIYLNDGDKASWACSTTTAFCAALTAYNLYRLVVDLGGERKYALGVSAAMYLSPGFLYYTTDMYKDAFVALFVVGAVSSAIRLAREFTVTDAIACLLYMILLWFVRFYMVFMCSIPLLVGLVGLNSKNKLRPILMILGIVAAAGVVLATTPLIDQASERVQDTLDEAREQAIGNARGGSGVKFDDGGNPWRALHLKIPYTLFSPFLWDSGSLGFQLGKVDVLIWYYLAYRAWRSAKVLMRDDLQLLATFLSFLAPATIIYSATMANVGLILRQRLPIVMLASVLGALSWTLERKRKEQSAEPQKAPPVPLPARRFAATRALRDRAP